MVRALASHQCGPGANPCVNAICGLSLLLVLSLAPRSFSSGTQVSPLLKTQHFQIPILSGTHVVGSLPCSERFFSGYSGFPLSSKTNISKFQFDQESGRRRTTMWMCYLQIVIYLFIYLFYLRTCFNGFSRTPKTVSAPWINKSVTTKKLQITIFLTRRSSPSP